MNINFSDNFDDWKRNLHIDKYNVIDAIKNYDRKQPFSYNGLNLMLYSKKQRATQTYMIVCGNHDADIYTVYWAISMLSSELVPLDNEDPISLVQKIVLKFGMNIRIGKQVKRFILAERIAIQRSEATNYMNIDNPLKHSACLSQFMQLKDDKDGLFVDCVLTFCIDAEEYLKATYRAVSSLGNVYIIPQLKGVITPIDFTNIDGNFSFSIDYSQIREGGRLFTVSFPNYFLEAGFTPGELYIQRNEYRASFPLSGLESEENLYCEGHYGLSELTIKVLDSTYKIAVSSGSDIEMENKKRTRTIQTPPTVPPNELLQWARKLNVIPVMTYDSQEDLYQSILTAVKSIQEKVIVTDMQNAFWDLSYDGSKILLRNPKKEPGIVSTIHGLLFDTAKLKNFEIYPEHPVAGGKLDFLIAGYLTKGEIVKVCIEFKHAHSDDLASGLITQLPAYMRGEASNFGIYLVLYFRGIYFDKPKYSIDKLELILHKLKLSNGIQDITIVFLDLSIRPPPSKI